MRCGAVRCPTIDFVVVLFWPAASVGSDTWMMSESAPAHGSGSTACPRRAAPSFPSPTSFTPWGCGHARGGNALTGGW